MMVRMSEQMVYKNYFFSLHKIDNHVIIFSPATKVLKLYTDMSMSVFSSTSNVVSSAYLNNILISDKGFRSLAITMYKV